MKKNSISTNNENKKKRSILLTIIEIILLLLLIETLLYTIKGNGIFLGKYIFPKQSTTSPVQDVDEIKNIPFIDDSISNENATSNDSLVDKNYFSVEVVSNSVYRDGVLETYIANPASNSHDCRIELSLHDGNVIYQSDVLKPNQYINKITVKDIPLNSNILNVNYNILDKNSKVIGVQIVETKLEMG